MVRVTVMVMVRVTVMVMVRVTITVTVMVICTVMVMVTLRVMVTVTVMVTLRVMVTGTVKMTKKQKKRWSSAHEAMRCQSYYGSRSGSNSRSWYRSGSSLYALWSWSGRLNAWSRSGSWDYPNSFSGIDT